jgi:hypothetical protein
MARVFLDANCIIDILQERTDVGIDDFRDHSVHVSALSFHIVTYIGKRKMPDKDLSDFISLFRIVDLNNDLIQLSLLGPTSDFEDNVQLNSAVLAECDIFLTRDRHIISMKLFGKMRIVEKLT